MQPTASRNVWTHLSSTERAAIAEAIVRILTEEVDNERGLRVFEWVIFGLGSPSNP